MIRAVIIDDENPAVEVLSLMLEKYCPGTHIMGTANDSKTGAEIIRSTAPDLVFPGCGNARRERVRCWRMPAMLLSGSFFVTGYDEYAIRALQHAAITIF